MFATAGVVLFRVVRLGTSFLDEDPELLGWVAGASAAFTVWLSAATGFALAEQLAADADLRRRGRITLTFAVALLSGVSWVNFALFDEATAELAAPLVLADERRRDALGAVDECAKRRADLTLRVDELRAQFDRERSGKAEAGSLASALSQKALDKSWQRSRGSSRTPTRARPLRERPSTD